MFEHEDKFPRKNIFEGIWTTNLDYVKFYWIWTGNLLDSNL